MDLRFLPAGNPAFWLISAPFFLLLFLLSIFSVSLIVEKLLLLRRWRCRNKRLPALASRLLQQGGLKQLGHLLALESGPEAILLRSSFDFIRHELEGRLKEQLEPIPINENDLGPANAVNAEAVLPPASRAEIQNRLERLEYWVESCIAKLGLQLEKHCNLFHLIANVATLLGLLGTVTGMIYAFWSGALEGGNRLSGGIAQALLTTAGGLIVAIPAIAAQHLFLNAANWRTYGLEQLGEEILHMEQRRLEAWMGCRTENPAISAIKRETATETAREPTTLPPDSEKTAARPPNDSAPISVGKGVVFAARMAQLERRRRQLQQKYPAVPESITPKNTTEKREHSQPPKTSQTLRGKS